MKSFLSSCFWGGMALISCLFAGGCKQTVFKAEATPTENTIEADMLAAQTIAVRQEKENIEAFCRRSGWNWQPSESGLYMDIYQKAPDKAPIVARGEAVRLHYTLHLLNGQMVASSEQEGLKTFIVGESDVESGLTEAVLRMRRGDCARLILPSHLAYGFSGDGKQIPPLATLLYDICIEEILVPPKNKR